MFVKLLYVLKKVQITINPKVHIFPFKRYRDPASKITPYPCAFFSSPYVPFLPFKVRNSAGGPLCLRLHLKNKYPTLKLLSLVFEREGGLEEGNQSAQDPFKGLGFFFGINLFSPVTDQRLPYI